MAIRNVYFIAIEVIAINLPPVTLNVLDFELPNNVQMIHFPLIVLTCLHHIFHQSLDNNSRHEYIS